MRLLCLAAALAALATPALADTLQEVTTKGLILMLDTGELEVTYKPDGSFTALDGAVVGKWRIDGTKLCTLSNYEPTESCVEYPIGKKSGDTFEVTGPQGPATVRIK